MASFDLHSKREKLKHTYFFEKADRRNVRLRKREVTWREGRPGCAQVSLVLCETRKG